MLHCRDGVGWVMICVQLLPDIALCIQAKEFNFRLIRPQTLFPHALILSRAFLQTPGMRSCAFFSGVASILPISHKVSICEVLQRLLSFWQVVPSQPRNSVVLSEWSLGSWSPPWPRFLRNCSVWWDNQFKEVWVVPHSFHFIMMELTVLLETFNTRNCFIPFPRSMPPHNSIYKFYGQFLGLHGRVSALTCTVYCGMLYRKVCFFLNHIQSI